MINRDIPRRLFAFEASAEVVLHQVGDGTIAAVVAIVGPPAVAEATKPATILFLLTINLPEEREEGVLGGLLGVCSSADGDGVDGRIESGVVGRIGPAWRPVVVSSQGVGVADR